MDTDQPHMDTDHPHVDTDQPHHHIQFINNVGLYRLKMAVSVQGSMRSVTTMSARGGM